MYYSIENACRADRKLPGGEVVGVISWQCLGTARNISRGGGG
jgi:hypothetical protein